MTEPKAIHILYMEDDPGLAHFVRKTLEGIFGTFSHTIYYI